MLLLLLVAQSCLTLCNNMGCSMPRFPVLTISWSLLKLMSIESMMLSNHLILYHPLLFLPSVFPGIRVFSNESTVCSRWKKYWSFSISPSNEYSKASPFSFSSEKFDLDVSILNYPPLFQEPNYCLNRWYLSLLSDKHSQSYTLMQKVSNFWITFVLLIKEIHIFG